MKITIEIKTPSPADPAIDRFGEDMEVSLPLKNGERWRIYAGEQFVVESVDGRSTEWHELNTKRADLLRQVDEIDEKLRGIVY
jgi:hypothetical protein